MSIADRGGPSSSGVSVPRGQLQSRLITFAKVLLLVDVVYVTLFVIAMALDPEVGVAGLVASGAFLEMIPELVLWSIAWAVFAARPLSTRTLEVIEVCVLLCAGCLYASWVLLHPLGAMGVYEMLLSWMAVFLFRAFIVPAIPRRTALVTAAACAPGFLLLSFADETYLPLARHTMLVVAITWLAVAVGFATVAASVIHTLRREVRHARRLGQYTLVELLGEGGMGRVYRARHALLRRPTALKLLLPSRSSERAVVRFEREVQLTSELAHPNVISIFDFGRTDDGLFYYVMEYLDGVDLHRLLAATGPLPEARAKHILDQVASALAAAHERGLVHRDIKPANVILCPRRGLHDAAKVCDFGLVKDLTAAEESGATLDHQILGTPLYMPPETVSGEELDERSDLYALGALAYALLAGAPPFRGTSVVEVCSKHLLEEPTPLVEAASQSVSPALAALIHRCLHKKREARPDSARAFLRELRACTDVPSWTEDEAEAWWEAHRGLLEARSTGELSQAVQVARA